MTDLPHQIYLILLRGKIREGKYQIEDSNLIIHWYNTIEKGKFKSDTVLILNGKIYKKLQY